MDYVIKNHKNLYIKLNKNGKAVACTEHERSLFEYSKAKNIPDSLPKGLKQLKFKVEAVPDIIQKKTVIGEKDAGREEYVPSESITRWIEEFGKCGDILSEAEKGKNSFWKGWKIMTGNSLISYILLK